ncbi:MAG: endonuclease/exonuclease/phosphatase family protein [Anaerolineales bacterium]|nr:endonuclease/exonuclease/phosphatase family protein [Anaerolineales bacterium]
MLRRIFINLFLVFAILLSLGVSVTSATPPAQEELTYTVKLGDYLWILAEKYLGSGPAYWAIFGVTNAKHEQDSSFARIEDPGLIHPGWKLLIPSTEDPTKYLEGFTPPPAVISVDNSLRPTEETAPTLDDGVPREIVSVRSEQGDQNDFVSNEIVLITDDSNELDGFLARWEGQVIHSENGSYLIRINPSLADHSALQAYLQPGAYQVTSEEALDLLAVVASEGSAGYLVDANWVGYQPITQAGLWERIEGSESLSAVLKADCGSLIEQEYLLFKALMRGGPEAELAEQQFNERIMSVDLSQCEPICPEYTLTEAAGGLVLPAVDRNWSDKDPICLKPPEYIPEGFDAGIVSSTYGLFHHTNSPYGYHNDSPLGGRLYGGNVTLSRDRQRLALSPTPTGKLRACARTEIFTIRLTHASGQSDFQVTLPVDLDIVEYNRTSRTNDFWFLPGRSVDISLCAYGGQEPMTWRWIDTETEDDLVPPPDLDFQSTTDGKATITGTVQIPSYYSEGILQVEQAGEIDTSDASISVHVNLETFSGNACGSEYQLIRGEDFSCELPTPTGYALSDYTWEVISGGLPPGLKLTQSGRHWYIEGVVDVDAPVDLHTIALELNALGIPLLSEEIAFNIVIPFRVWTQNTTLRPSRILGIVKDLPNTGSDNEERAQLILNRINDFDIIALQEVFGGWFAAGDQTSRLARGAFARGFAPLLGPDNSLAKTSSGLLLLVRGSLSSPENIFTAYAHLLPLHQSYKFVTEGQDDDKWANKGFTVTKVFLDAKQHDHFVFVVNTHLQAAYDDSGGQYKDVRANQLGEIRAVLSAPRFRNHPVLLMGDFNIRATTGRFIQTGSEHHGLVHGDSKVWEDLVRKSIRFPRRADTIDETRNPYAHFWDDHLDDHEWCHSPFFCGALPGPAFDFCLDYCLGSFSHPTDQTRLDYILVRQGSEFQLIADSVKIENDRVATEMCRDEFPMSDEPGLVCYLSDHYGVSADLVFVRNQP